MDFAATSWFTDDDPEIILLKQFEKTFGSDESVILLFEIDEGSIFTPENINILHNLTEEMWLVPEVMRVESLTNYNWSYAEADNLITEPFLPEDRIDDKSFLKDREKEALEHRVLPGVFFSRNLKSATVYGRITYNPAHISDYESITLASQAIADEFEKKYDHIKVHVLGQSALNHTFQRTSFNDLSILMPLLVLLIILYLFYSFRSVIGVFIPLTIIFTSIGVTGGIAGLFGFKINSLTFILPSVLVAISIADSVHILTTFFDSFSRLKDIGEAAKKSLHKNMWPIFLTTVTTTIGFLSLTVSDILPVKELGILAGVGVCVALLFSYLLIIPILIFMSSERAKNNKPITQRLLPKHHVQNYLEWVARWSKTIIACFFSLTIVMGYLGMQNEINSNPYKYFKPNDPLSIGNDYVLEHYGGVAGPEIIIDSGVAEGIKDPQFLRKVEKFQNWLTNEPYVNRVMSIIDILKEMNQALNEGDPQEYRISDSREVIAQEIFLYSLSLPIGMDLNNRVDLNERELRLSVLWELQDSRISLEKLAVIESKAEEIGLPIQITGKPILFQKMNDYVVQTFFTSIAMALIFITFILILIFRSYRIGLMSLIPNFVPIIFGAGLLTILGIPVDIGCAIVASVTLGVAVDDTIHFLSHYKQLVMQGMERTEALTEVLRSTGMALIITTVILVSCFGLFIFASLAPNINFGILASFVIAVALICDFLVLPALILQMKHKH